MVDCRKLMPGVEGTRVEMATEEEVADPIDAFLVLFGIVILRGK